MALKPALMQLTEVTLPISKRLVTIRPYSSREEKVMLATNKENRSAVVNTLENLVVACTDESVTKKDVTDMCVQDLMFLVMQLNFASVGRIKKLTIPCDACDTGIKVQFDNTVVLVESIWIGIVNRT